MFKRENQSPYFYRLLSREKGRGGDMILAVAFKLNFLLRHAFNFKRAVPSTEGFDQGKEGLIIAVVCPQVVITPSYVFFFNAPNLVVWLY